MQYSSIRYGSVSSKLKFKNKSTIHTTTMKSRQNHFFAATLLLLSIFSENSVTSDVSVEDVNREEERSHHDDVTSGADERENVNVNVVGSKGKVANNLHLEGNSIDDEGKNNSHDIPSSIAKATLVGARLRQQLHENDKNTDTSHHSDTIDVNLLDWSELPTPMKEAALTLGCNSQMWDSNEESSQCKLFWSELTEEEQKAAMVLGYQSSSWDDDNVQDEQETIAPEAAAADENTEYHNPKAGQIPGCHHWGTMGCNKGNPNAGSATTTAASKINATPGVFDDDDESMVLHQSSLAGSATAKIEAHVLKGAGKSSPLSAKKDRFQTNEVGVDSTASSSNNPPQGFTLSARIVTSPQDGLSYFLDVPDGDMTTMMTIPYTFLDCGRNIESTTEAFSLDDLVVRHLPAGADIGHWVNLGGGVTIDTEDEYEDSFPRYINGNHDGRPKLLVALSPIEIVVSGNDEESRTFNPGEIILMEDTLGKGHKMKANSPGKDLKVIMISLPHTVHYPPVSWSSVQEENTNNLSPSGSESSWHRGAHQSLFGFAPKNHHPRSKARHTTKPCPLEYDSVYSSLFTPTSNKNLIRQKRRRRKMKDFATTADSSDGSSYPPAPGFTTSNNEDIFKYLPTLRQSMLIGIGLSLTSSFVYCAQLLYPPFLVLWGGATIVVLGAVVNVMGVRWLLQQNWMVVWEEERRWKRDLKRHKKRKEKEAAAAVAAENEKSRGAVDDGE